jgi:methionyl-tRNA synthetase
MSTILGPTAQEREERLVAAAQAALDELSQHWLRSRCRVNETALRSLEDALAAYGPDDEPWEMDDDGGAP